MGKHRAIFNNPNCKWQVALAKLRTALNLTDEQFEEMFRNGKCNNKAQRNIIYWADPATGRAANRAAYAKYAERRREDARMTRRYRKLDPVATENDRAYRRQRRKYREATDPIAKIRRRFRTRVFMALKGYAKSTTSGELLGCSLEHARQWIESKFQPGMTWQNWTRSGWHLDHIRPCIAFDLSDPDQQRQCFHYTNLQPLWAQDNWKKGALV